jgi:hypothetical protein
MAQVSEHSSEQLSPPKDRAKHYRGLASDALGQAASTRYDEIAEGYLKLARKWNDMADDLGRVVN